MMIANEAKEFKNIMDSPDRKEEITMLGNRIF